MHPAGSQVTYHRIWHKNDQLFRLGWPRQPNDTPTRRVPAWQVSPVGLGLEQPSTYTAFNGVRVLPMLLETRDFRRIHIHTLNGRCVQNKGMALFPRRINGKYAMCSRIDGHNLYLMYSDHPYFWEEATVLARPRQPWELRLMGNCGSPLETPAGWLLITHGVGPMRRYCIGAMLLDRDDPSRVIGRLREPLLAPTAEEREGYVPNVVYSCGSMIHGDKLFLPYAMSDTATGMATITLQELLDALLDSKEYCG